MFLCNRVNFSSLEVNLYESLDAIQVFFLHMLVSVFFSKWHIAQCVKLAGQIRRQTLPKWRCEKLYHQRLHRHVNHEWVVQREPFASERA